MEQNIATGEALFGSASGRWATAALKAEFAKTGRIATSALRTLDTLRHEEWKFFDDALVAEAVIRLVGVGDLIAAGLTRNVPNALGKTVFGYEQITNMDAASTSLDGISRTMNDRQEFNLNQLPLPITHKDFFINLRQLTTSREKGEPLDTTGARQAGRRVAEQLELMLFQGGPTFGSLPLYGYTTFPDRKTGNFKSHLDWGNASKPGVDYLSDVIQALTALQAVTNRMYGPYTIYIPADAGIQINNDYNPGTANIQSIRNRLLQVEGINAIRVADQLPSGNVIIKQDTVDVAAWVQGEPLQTVQWDEYGGFQINFKAFAIGIPLMRSDAAHRCGIYHLNG